MNIIFLNTNGTLYSYENQQKLSIDSQTLKDIKFAQDKNIEFVFCIENGYLENISNLAKKLNVRYIIASNGASIFDRQKNNFIFKSKITIYKANKILQKNSKNGIATIWWDEKNIYVNKFVTKSIIKIIKMTMQETKEIIVSNKIEKNIFKIEIYNEFAQIKTIEEIAQKLNLQFIHMNKNHFGITNPQVSKGLAIKTLCKILKINLQDTMAIGNSINDLKMFEVVNHSYAMDNSPKKFKQYAKHYTSDVKQNGVGMAIIDYMYREKLDR